MGILQNDERDLRDIRVLLIEDDDDDHILIRRLLAEVPLAQYDVTWIHAYEEGLKELAKGIYDVCLLDYQLGSETGLEILREVKDSPATPPIIILTGQGDYPVDLRAMEYGAADYLVKDRIDGPMLERAIRYCIQRKKSKDALRESERQLKHLSSALLKVLENERRMLAAELHDDLVQLLMAIKFRIESIQMRMDPGEAGVSELEALVPSIMSAVEQVRNMYTQLMPTVLDDLGILATLRWFCREFQKEHPDVEVEWEFEIKELEIAADLRLVIFRIAQDAFQNIVDHSGARHVRVLVSGENACIRLEIRDDGAGFKVFDVMSRADTDSGLGLMIMKRRAELSGGTLRIESAEGGGTLVVVQWPLER